MAIANYHRLRGQALEDANKELGIAPVEPEPEPEQKKEKKK